MIGERARTRVTPPTDALPVRPPASVTGVPVGDGQTRAHHPAAITGRRGRSVDTPAHLPASVTGIGGQAVVETLLLGLLFLVPLIWALGVLSELHRAALASTSAAREAGFDAARTGTERDAAAAIAAAVRQAFDNQGLDAADARIRWSAGGLRRGGDLEIEISYPVTVAQAPMIGRAGGPSIWVRARHIARIDPYRSR